MTNYEIGSGNIAQDLELPEGTQEKWKAKSTFEREMEDLEFAKAYNEHYAKLLASELIKTLNNLGYNQEDAPIVFNKILKKESKNPYIRTIVQKSDWQREIKALKECERRYAKKATSKKKVSKDA